MYSKIFESTELEHLLLRKVFTALLDQVRSKVMFSIDSHNFGLFFAARGVAPCWPVEIMQLQSTCLLLAYPFRHCFTHSI